MGLIIIDLLIHTEADKHGKDSLVKQTQENVGGSETNKTDDHEWSSWGCDLLEITVHLHELESNENIENGKTDLAQ